MDWKDYQEKVAIFFRSLGLEAETDVTITGIRTKHDIDVLIKSHYAGFDITWIVECKYWNSKVSKLHVFALREIVNDTGVDRGIILAENGFQSGAIEAAALTNVHVLSLNEITNTASHDILSMQLREIYDRLLWCKEKYWDIPKQKRIEYGLRPDTYESGYSGTQVIQVVEEFMSKGFRGIYPIIPDALYIHTSEIMLEQKLPQQINSLKELVTLVEYFVKNLERKIEYCLNNFYSS